MSTPLGSAHSNSWLSSLPLILCGPILRKVHYESVSVWLAFKDDVTDIRLNVFAASNPSSPLLSGTVARPLKLGKNLFVTLVTATSSGTKLAADLQYSVTFIRSAGYGIAAPLASNILRSSQSAKFKDRGNVSPVPGTAVGKDNLALISFAPDSIVTNIWLANGTREKPDDREADRLLFPYIKHPASLSPSFSMSELPVKEFDKIRARFAMR